jgi:hypothetical protein
VEILECPETADEVLLNDAMSDSLRDDLDDAELASVSKYNG